MSYARRLKWRVGYTVSKVSTGLSELFWSVVGALSPKRLPPEVTVLTADSSTSVDLFWREHTVNSKPFKAAAQSEKYLAWRSEIYPLFIEFLQPVWGGVYRLFKR